MIHKNLFPELTDTEAAAPTGEIRKLMYAIIDGFYNQIRNKNASLAETARPTRMRVVRNISEDEETGLTTRRYTFTFITSPPPAGSTDVAPEV